MITMHATSKTMHARTLRFAPVMQAQTLFRIVALVGTMLVPAVSKCAAEDSPRLRPPATDANGFLVHEIESPYQSGTTRIRVLVRDKLETGRRYPVVYVLPVESGTEHRYGDGLVEVKNQDLHNKYEAIFVAPTFSHTPWFADHPSDPTIRQETYLVKTVVPLVDATYPVVAAPSGRLLVGFSKSGWGAWTLLMRNPQVFGRAAAWDSPMLMDRFDMFRSGAIFGTDENFRRYQITTLLNQRAEPLRQGKRLILMGYGPTPQGHREVHVLLDELMIPHAFRDGPERSHDWHSGWVSEAVELVLASGE